MNTQQKLLTISLTLFDGDAAGTGGAANAAPAPEAARGRREKSESERVQYGKAQTQDAPAPAQPQSETAVTSDTLEARRAEFDKLVRGDFKDLYDEAIRGAAARQETQSRAMEQRMGAMAQVCELLAGKYGVKADDPKALAAAIEQDDAYWEEAAEQAGMSTEQYRVFSRMERENAQFRKMAEEQRREQYANQTLQRWQQQARDMAEDYPNFDFERECAENTQFASLLNNNVDVRTAYEVTHMDDIKQRTAQATQRNVTDTIRAKGLRPQENGAAAAGGVLVKNDVSKLTRADRAEIARRVARGETIIF